MRLIVATFLLVFQVAQAQQLPNFSVLAEKNEPAVVNISTTRKYAETRRLVPRNFGLPDEFDKGPMGELFRHFFDEQGSGTWPTPESHSLGSGFIISSDGYIVTNHHVITEADEIIVRLNDRSELEAKLIGSDPRSDIALLKIDSTGLPVVTLGDSSRLKVGEWVLAIGSPFGFDHTVTAGIVSAIQRSLPSDSYVPFIQTDVAINPGNSGGPLINLDGEVVGVNSQIVSGSGGYMGLSFAIPIDLAMDVVNQLKSSGRVTRGWLGVLIQEVTRELAESFKMDKPKGALVSKVLPGSPADKGGIETGDIILEFESHAIEWHNDLPPLVGKFGVGKSAQVKVLRNGRLKTLKIKIGELPADEIVADADKVAPTDKSRMGLVVGELSPQSAERLGIKEGVEVEQIKSGPAAAAGMRRGDVITSVNQQPVSSVDDFIKKIDAMLPGGSVAFLVQRASGPIYIAVRLSKNEP
ncbi:MAG: DegQ family serine endoprotease [Gammaproteobacteria bacterium]|nr:DegQ family serine endoprotease [Gammaproteobacteria bacterium]